MPGNDSVAELMARLKSGEDGAAREVFVRFAGRLVGLGLRVRTTQFGDQRVRFADVRSLRAAGETGHPPAASADAPANLIGYQGQFGKLVVLRVTGAVAGSVWGSGPYTLDSTLAAAAVHAGVLRPGQAGVVRVRVVPSPGGFIGSVRNGVSTAGFGPFAGGAFEFVGR